MSAVYSEWLRENLAAIALAVIGVTAAGVVFWYAGTRFAGWLIGRAERRDRWRLTSGRLSVRVLDLFHVARCAITGHDWTVNSQGTQRVCYRCWTVDDGLAAARRASHGEAR